MYWTMPGGLWPGLWTFDVYIDNVNPIGTWEEIAARIVLDCPESFDLRCSVTRF
jgi:hypothetical protein